MALSIMLAQINVNLLDAANHLTIFDMYVLKIKNKYNAYIGSINSISLLRKIYPSVRLQRLSRNFVVHLFLQVLFLFKLKNINLENKLIKIINELKITKYVILHSRPGLDGRYIVCAQYFGEHLFGKMADGKNSRIDLKNEFNVLSNFDGFWYGAKIPKIKNKKYINSDFYFVEEIDKKKNNNNLDSYLFDHVVNIAKSNHKLCQVSDLTYGRWTLGGLKKFVIKNKNINILKKQFDDVLKAFIIVDNMSGLFMAHESHGDCVPWNFWSIDDKLVFIDFERYSMSAPAFFDYFYYSLSQYFDSVFVDSKSMENSLYFCINNIVLHAKITKSEAKKLCAISVLLVAAERLTEAVGRNSYHEDDVVFIDALMQIFSVFYCDAPNDFL